MKIKYAICTESFEFNPTKYSTPEEAYWAYDDHNDKRIALFDTLEEARQALNDIRVETASYSYKLSRATIAYIEEAEFDQDEDGEWEFVDGSNYYDFKYE